MKTYLVAMAVIASLACSASSQAAVIDLFEYGVNVDGTYTNLSVNPAPAGVSLAGFNPTTGLGTITATFTTVGAHYFGVYVDHEIDELINTFFNEFGSVTGAPPAGLTWEIDEPGFVFGDIFTNINAGTLDNSNGVPAATPDDVAMALARSFTLLAGETATVSVTVTETAPTSGFYLTQTDPDSQASIYMRTSLTINTNGAVPEPATLAIWSLGLLGTSLVRYRRRHRAA